LRCSSTSPLVERFRGGGLDVCVVLDGPSQSLPVGVDVSAHRVVQESLTNALKYAAGRTASLRLTRAPTVLEIRASTTSSPGTVGHSGDRRRDG